MNRLIVSAAIAGAVGYLVLLSWSMTNLDYDAWGALVVIPPLALVSALAIRMMFTGELQSLVGVMYAGFVLKLVGAAGRFWVSFDAYGGSTDAQRYHDFGKKAAGAVWDGTASLRSVVPSGTGSVFMDRLTGFIYTFVGSSRMAGFVIFACMGFWGVAFFVKAACIAVPGLLRRRYAILCVAAPSLVYWPSSIGKDAWMIWTLGIASLGFAWLLGSHRIVVPILLSAAGLAGAAFVRPHIAGMWIAGLLPALLVSVARGRVRQGDGRQSSGRGAMLLVTGVALGGAAMIGSAALRYLDFNGDDPQSSSNVTSILDETTRRTAQAGSNFTPPSLDSPLNWPFAIVRTLTRPLPFEVHSAFQMLSALEMAALVGLCLTSWRRIGHLPRVALRVPYITFAVFTTFAAGLAYSSFANLGVLTRQKSLVLPLLLLLPCLPTRSRQNNSMSPSERFQFDSGGTPASLTERHVRIGPP